MVGLFPLVMLNHIIDNGNNHTFHWKKVWGLGWGLSPQRIESGVMYRPGGAVTTVQPNQANGHNEIIISWDRDNFTSSPGYYNRHLKLGDMRIKTDKSFTVKDSYLMSVAVYMFKKPILVMRGQPNTVYLFNTDTSYYLTVTNAKEKTALPYCNTGNSKVYGYGLSMSCPTKVYFPISDNEATYKLTQSLTFEPVK